jgi:hypothetical protein
VSEPCEAGCLWCDFNRGVRYSRAFTMWLAHPDVTRPPDRDASDMQWDAWAAENGLEFVHVEREKAQA